MCHLTEGKHEAQLSLGRLTVPLIFKGQHPTADRGKKAISQSEYSPPCTLWFLLLYRTLQ